MKILVYGAGAIGSVIGGFLASAGHKVSFLGRPWHMEKVSETGLYITGIWGDHLVDDIDTYTEFTQVPQDSSYDLILITVKSYDTEKAGKEVKDLIKEDTLVVHLQNGLGNAEKLMNYIPEDKLITGRVIFGVEIEPGVVKVTVSADEIVLGTIGSVHPSIIKEISDIFSRAGLPARLSTSIDKHLWGKALYNCALNPLATILEVPYGFLAENEFTTEIMDKVIEEIYQVGGELKVDFEPLTAEEYKDQFYSKLVPATAEHHASMLQDIKRGKPTEIDALNGAIAAYGEGYGVETPYNTLLTSLIKAKEIKSNSKQL
ncbi:MAG: ketopantoate reductase family protein [Archaeoglobaceae archaeon]